MADPRHKSVRVSKRADRRVQRTQRELGMAFAELLTRRSYHSIRVSDITRKAAVGRATFYAHFDRKEDLLRTQLGGVIEAPVEPPAMLARHAAASLFDLLDWWFEHDMPMTPAQINAAYQALLPA